MRFSVLSSGSKGNALWLESHGVVLMVEAGLSPRRLKQRMDGAGVSGRAPHALFITHGHHDHVNHAAEVAGAFGIPTLATAGTAASRVGGAPPLHAHVEVKPGVATRVGHLVITPFGTPHDAPGSVGLVVEDGEHRVGMVTDLGCVTDVVVDALRDCSLLYAEFNHDVQLLMDGPYPWSLKQRCRSNVGHLSNEQGAELVSRARGPLLRTLLLAHLSEANNTPELAMFAARRVLDGSGVDIQVAPQRAALAPLDVGPAARPMRASTFRPVAVPPRVAVSVPAAAVPAARVRRPNPEGRGPSAQLSLFV